ncbi:MAG: tetratricopeptide repeat protein [Kangiellaceae bacterium]|nr:tetratricopeptide repeat protein [Kangiellaceae bacterium]
MTHKALTPTTYIKQTYSQRTSSLRHVGCLLLLSCTLLSGLTACSTATKHQTIAIDSQPEAIKSGHPNITHLDPDQRSQLYFSILLADIAQRQGLFEVAQGNFLDAADKTSSVALAKQAALISLQEKKYADALQAVTIWQQAAPDDASVHKVALVAHLALRQYTQAEQDFERLLPLLPSNKDEQLYQLIQLGSYQEDIDFISFFDEQNNKNSASSSTTSRAKIANPVLACVKAYFLLKSENADAQTELIHQLLDSALAQEPAFLSAIELKGEAWLLDSRDKREQYFEQVLAQNILNQKQTFRLAELLYTQKSYSTAIKAFQTVLANTPQTEVDSSSALQAKYLMAGSYYALEQYPQSAELFALLTAQDYKPDISSYYCADSALRDEDYDLAIECYLQVPRGNYYLKARTQLAQLYADQGQWQRGQESLQQAQRNVGLADKQRLLQFEIDYLTQLQQYELAQRRINSALQIEPDNSSLYYLQLQLLNQSQSVEQFVTSVNTFQLNARSAELRKEISLMAAGFLQNRHSYLLAYKLLEQESQRNPEDLDLLYNKALAGEPLGYYAQLERDLRLILTIKPDHIDAMNALGYTLADMNRSLEEAQRLVEAAYQKDPESSAIQDSMGWIQYRLGNLQNALTYLQSAYDKTPAAEIAAHLGEVLWMLDQKDQARQIWQKALQKEPNNQYILRTLRRFPEANIASGVGV